MGSSPIRVTMLRAYQMTVKELEEFQQLTGYNSPEEMDAFEQGVIANTKTMIDFINDWDGSTNSMLGDVLMRKFRSLSYPEVTRVEVIDYSPNGKGRSYVNMNVKNLQLSLQDADRTLKLFIK